METASTSSGTRYYVMAVTPTRLYSFTGIGLLEVNYCLHRFPYGFPVCVLLLSIPNKLYMHLVRLFRPDWLSTHPHLFHREGFESRKQPVVIRLKDIFLTK